MDQIKTYFIIFQKFIAYVLYYFYLLLYNKYSGINKKNRKVHIKDRLNLLEG